MQAARAAKEIKPKLKHLIEIDSDGYETAESWTVYLDSLEETDKNIWQEVAQNVKGFVEAMEHKNNKKRLKEMKNNFEKVAHPVKRFIKTKVLPITLVAGIAAGGLPFLVGGFSRKKADSMATPNNATEQNENNNNSFSILGSGLVFFGKKDPTYYTPNVANGNNVLSGGTVEEGLAQENNTDVKKENEAKTPKQIDLQNSTNEQKSVEDIIAEVMATESNATKAETEEIIAEVVEEATEVIPETVVEEANTEENAVAVTLEEENDLDSYHTAMFGDIVNIQEDAQIYSNIDDAAKGENGKHSYYGTGEERVVYSIALVNEEGDVANVYNFRDYEEKIADGYDVSSYTVVNQHSKGNGNKLVVEGRYKADDIVLVREATKR